MRVAIVLLGMLLLGGCLAVQEQPVIFRVEDAEVTHFKNGHLEIYFGAEGPEHGSLVEIFRGPLEINIETGELKAHDNRLDRDLELKLHKY